MKTTGTFPTVEKKLKIAVFSAERPFKSSKI